MKLYLGVLSYLNSPSHNRSTMLSEAGKGVFHPTEHSYAKKKNRSENFCIWRYSILIDRLAKCPLVPLSVLAMDCVCLYPQPYAIG